MQRENCPVCQKTWDLIEMDLQACRECHFQTSFNIEIDWELIDKRLSIYEDLLKREDNLNASYNKLKEEKEHNLNELLESKREELKIFDDLVEKRRQLFKIGFNTYKVIFFIFYFPFIIYGFFDSTSGLINAFNLEFEGWVSFFYIAYFAFGLFVIQKMGQFPRRIEQQVKLDRDLSLHLHYLERLIKEMEKQKYKL